MRRQWPCSKCGFAYASTWRSLNTTKPVICNTCRSKRNKNKVMILPPKQVPNDNNNNNSNNNNNGAKITGSLSSSFDQMGSSSSEINENMGFAVSQIGMIFGNLPFEPSLTAAPAVIVGSESQDPKVKIEQVDGDDDDFCCVKPSAPSLLEIKQEYDSEADPSVWDPNKVQKKKRSKLPQYTLSPLARFINQLHHISYINNISTCDHHKNKPKYDDVLIYEKCNYVPENEIGLGVMLLPNPPTKQDYSSHHHSTAESTHSSSSDANSNCLLHDVPIKATPSH